MSGENYYGRAQNSGRGWGHNDRGNGGDRRDFFHHQREPYRADNFRDPRDQQQRDRPHGERNYDDRRKNDFGGRGGRGFGGRGEGMAKHMGEHSSITNLQESHHFSDSSCLAVIATNDTEREDRVLGNDPLMPRSRALPALDPWRLDDPVGLPLNQRDQAGVPLHTLRSNFFRVNASAIPEIIFHYNISVFRYKHSSGDLPSLGADPEDLAQKGDKFLTTSVVRAVLAALDHHWQDAGFSFGIAYDGCSSLYATRKLPFPNLDPPTLSDAYSLDHQFQHDVMAGAKPLYSVVVKYVKDIFPPRAAWAGAATASAAAAAPTPAHAHAASALLLTNREALQAMDVALLAFARKNLEQGQWFLSGNTIFSARDSKVYPLIQPFEGRLGYHASFRACLSGLALVKDISVTCFLRGGNLVKFLTLALGCEKRDLVPSGALRPGNRKADTLLAVLKSCAVRLTHLKNMRKKFRSLGPAANDPQSAFSVDAEQPAVTVNEYYAMRYNIRLELPFAPTVDVGTRQRPILIPMELIDIVPGQTRQRSVTGEVSAQIIQHAAMRPNDRFRALTQGSFLFSALQQDEDAQHFGLSNITGTCTDPGAAGTGSGSASTASGSAAPAVLPMRVMGTILPPAKLQYGRGRVIEPKLRGSWNLAGGIQFSHPAELPSGRAITMGVIAVCAHEGDFQRADQALRGLIPKLETESAKLGVPILHQDRVRMVVHQPARSLDLEDVLAALQALGVRIVVVLLMDESFYARVKFVADRLCLLTQCMRYSVVSKMPRNYETSLLIKMNAKLGGTNHTLASRAPKPAYSGSSGSSRRVEEDDGVFQQPPQSISWIFDEPTMVIGIDVNHPEPHAAGGEEASVVAVVASMDGMLSQYCAHISACSASREPVSSLYDSFVRLIKIFCERNPGQFPRNIIVYRDGVADSQFASTLDSELVALQQAIEYFNKDEDYVKLAFVVCQKRHHTRFFYKPAAGEEYMNPCVGLCVDARGFSAGSEASAASPPGARGRGAADELGCVVGSELIEFYLNSHAAVLGTSKPTRYVLLYDGIGFKLSELELLTFWLTHLYARCTRSVSIVAPAYYAHWAARRGRVLLSGSCGEMNSAQLKNMSGNWLLDRTQNGGMYFI